MANDWTFRFAGVAPSWLVVTIALLLIGAIAASSLILARRGLSPRAIALLASLRFAAAVCFLLILLQPILVRSREEASRSHALILFDRSRSMAAPSSADGKSRWQEAVDRMGSGAFASHLGTNYDASFYVFDDHAIEASRETLDGIKPDGSGTLVGECVESAWLQEKAKGRTPRRILLASDGVNQSSVDAAAFAMKHGIAIDVLIPSQSASNGVEAWEIADLQAPRRVLLGSETRLRLSLRRSSAADADKVRLRLKEDDREVWAGEANFPKGARETHVEMTYRPQTKGVKRCRIEATLDGKSLASADLSLEVADRHFEALVLEDSWRWELKHLKRIFEDDPGVRFTAVVSRGGNAFVQFASPDRRADLVGFPQNAADLERFDVVFLGNVDVARWPAGLADSLARQVTEEGRSLVVIGGPNLGQLSALPAIERLLPVELNADSGKPIEGPIETRFGADASASPFFFQLRDGDSLPPLDRVYPAVRKRAGASVLLEAADKRNAYGKLILLAEHRVGRGRVVFVGTDTLWKWHTLASPGDGPTPYLTFWQQAIRALAPVHATTGDGQIVLASERQRTTPGRAFAVDAELRGSSLRNAKLKAWLQTPDDRRLPLAMLPVGEGSAASRADIALPAEGTHTLVVQAVEGERVLAESTLRIQGTPKQGEDSGSPVDADALKRLAKRTGGSVIDPANPESWPKSESETLPPSIRIAATDPWSNGTLLLLLACFLGADWFLRLRRGWT